MTGFVKIGSFPYSEGAKRRKRPDLSFEYRSRRSRSQKIRLFCSIARFRTKTRFCEISIGNHTVSSSI